ncbi:MAG: hypothetical protein J6T70_09510, partial [Bacteroidales bacterium]|nr:hypothetical protein [Bacteroidales bacterium]
PDNSRIYYFCGVTSFDVCIIEVPIVKGVPDYNQKKTIYSEHKFGGMGHRDMYYSLDNKIYVIDYILKKISTIEINVNNETVFTDQMYTLDKNVISNNNFLSSWFMDNPCEENPCQTLPSAEFDNATVCYGEPLKVILSGTAPFEVFYSFDGQEKSFTTNKTEFQMANIPGKYIITKVKNGACESAPISNSSAVIVPELKKLTIIEK